LAFVYSILGILDIHNACLEGSSAMPPIACLDDERRHCKKLRWSMQANKSAL